MPSRTLNLSTKPSQIGIRCSGTRKCSQRYEIDHFCQWFFQPFSPLKFFLNPVGESPFYHSHVRYTDETKRKFEKSSASEVGVLWVAHRDRFWNLWFHHRGMKFSWNCAIVHGRFMSNLSKRTLTNCVSFQMHINKSWFRDPSNLSKRTLTNRVSGTNWEFIIGKSIRFWE